MTEIAKLSTLHFLFLAFAFSLGFHAEPARAQTTPTTQTAQPTPTTPATPLACMSEPRFVRVLNWGGRQVCELTGHGTGEDNGMPGSSARCLAGGGQVVTFGGYPYCVWDRAYAWAAIIYDPGTQPMPPDDIMFPTPIGPTEVLTIWSHCTQDPRLVRTLGRYRGVTVCQGSESGAWFPVTDDNCPGPVFPNGRVRVFPDDFVNPPAPSSTPLPANPVGTRYCVRSDPFWEARGIRAYLMARQPSHFDLGIDVHLARPLPPGSGPATFRIWVSSAQMLPAGGVLIVTGSLTPSHYFMPWTSAGQGWLCMGNWNAFSCRKTLTTTLSTPMLLEVPAPYLPTSSGQYITYSARATMTDNVDPVAANNIMAIGTNLY